VIVLSVSPKASDQSVCVCVCEVFPQFGSEKNAVKQLLKDPRLSSVWTENSANVV